MQLLHASNTESYRAGRLTSSASIVTNKLKELELEPEDFIECLAEEADFLDDSTLEVHTHCLGYKDLIDHYAKSKESNDLLPLIRRAQSIVDQYIAALTTRQIVQRVIPQEKTSLTKTKLFDELVDCVLFDNMLQRGNETREVLAIIEAIEHQTFFKDGELVGYQQRCRPAFPAMLHRRAVPSVEASNDVIEYVFKLAAGTFEVLLEHQQSSVTRPLSILIEYNDMAECLDGAAQRRDFSAMCGRDLAWISLGRDLKSFSDFVDAAFASHNEHESGDRNGHNLYYIDASRMRIHERTKRYTVFYNAKALEWSQLGHHFGFLDAPGTIDKLLKDPSKILLTAVPSLDGNGVQFYIQMCGTRVRCHSLSDVSMFFRNMQSLLGLAPKPYWREFGCLSTKASLGDETFRWCRELLASRRR